MHLFFRKKIYPVVSVLLLAFSCQEKPETSIEEGLTLKTPEVSHSAGNQFLTVSAGGEWTLDVRGVEETDAVPDWVRIRRGVTGEDVCSISGSGNDNVLLFWTANPGSESRSCRVVLTTSKGRYATMLTQATSAFKSDRVCGWLELPKVETDASHYFVSRDMTVGTRKSRNYAFLLDTDAKISLWVAYPLNRGLIGSGSRHFSGTTYWANTIDPKVPVEYQAVTERPFRGYQRGHQIPSADRLTSDPNFTTFYGTNMTPQLGELNAESWATLESMVRNWSNQFDTLYVVTGADIAGSSKTVKDNAGKSVTVPVGYFKALLGYKKSMTIADTKDNGGFAAIAFYFEHRSYENSSSAVMAQSMSVDALEKKLGYDFFPNLEQATSASTAAAVEASVSSWWK